MNKKIAIVGYGWVGKAMHKLFPSATVYSRKLFIYDDGEIGSPVELNYEEDQWKKEILDRQKDVNKCDVAFVCVPTPSLNSCLCDCHKENYISDQHNGLHRTENCLCKSKEGKLDTSIVEECIKWLDTPIIVVRSTVNPGDCDRWSRKYRKNIVMQPEYLGETPNHPLIDTINNPFLIIGSYFNGQEDGRKLIELYQTVTMPMLISGK